MNEPWRSVPRDMRPFAQSAIRNGWEITQTSRCHYRWTSPQGAVVVTSGTPGSHRAVRNVRAQLRALGLTGI